MDIESIRKKYKDVIDAAAISPMSIRQQDHELVSLLLEVDRLSAERDAERKRANAAVYMLNEPRKALEMCDAFTDVYKERDAARAEVENLRSLLASCHPAVEAVREYQTATNEAIDTRQVNGSPTKEASDKVGECMAQLLVVKLPAIPD